jgi:hypothetical protein
MWEKISAWWAGEIIHDVDVVLAGKDAGHEPAYWMICIYAPTEFESAAIDHAHPVIIIVILVATVDMLAEGFPIFWTKQQITIPFSDLIVALDILPLVPPVGALEYGLSYGGICEMWHLDLETQPWKT